MQLPNWIPPFTWIASGTTTSAGPGAIENTYVTPTPSETVIEHYVDGLRQQHVEYHSNSDGIGTTLRATLDRTACIIRIKQVDTGTGVKLNCEILPADQPVTVSIPKGTSTQVTSNSLEGGGPLHPSAQPTRELPGTHVVEYSIEGPVRHVSITGRNAGGGTEQHEVAVPYSKTLYVRGSFFAYLSAQKKGESGTIRVVIRVDGKILQQASASSPYGVASASGRTE
jgi:hypothetical protein